MHARAIFLQEQLVEGTHFAHQPVSEDGNPPDFLFPSVASYYDPAFLADGLRMLNSSGLPATLMEARYRAPHDPPA